MPLDDLTSVTAPADSSPEAAATHPHAPTVPPAPAAGSTILPRWLALAALSALLVFVVLQGASLWAEWSALQHEWSRARDSAVIGYVNVTINPSYAARPEDWYHHDGDSTLLWSGWMHKAGHQWFRVGRGEVEQSRITYPMGRDVIQAIDYPLVEIAGGEIWRRVPDTALVAGIEMAGVKSVYPLLLLDKVEVVNDTVGETPFLVAYNPMASREEAVCVYDPVCDGHRLTMGLSGYFHDKKPLLYDRGTESLWVDEADGLRAIAGRHKGAALRRVGRPSPMTWSAWRSQHPKSRLLVGADRSRPMPAL